jgi:hypothetical protein
MKPSTLQWHDHHMIRDNCQEKQVSQNGYPYKVVYLSETKLKHTICTSGDILYFMCVQSLSLVLHRKINTKDVSPTELIGTRRMQFKLFVKQLFTCNKNI